MNNTLPIHFAPLQGYTEAAYRNAHAAVFGGIDVYHTPFVRVDGESSATKTFGTFYPKTTGWPALSRNS